MNSKISGIYMLYYNDVKCYIGKSIDIHNRYKQHCRALKNNKHKNIQLAANHKKYGLPFLKIVEILPCDNNLLYNREAYWIEQFDSFKNGMNENMGGKGVGYGDGAPASIYTNPQIIQLVHYILANDTKNLAQISNETNISYGVVRSVAIGTSHAWLIKEIPIEYTKLMSLKGTRVHGMGYGENCANSHHTNEEIKEVFKLLLGELTPQQISTKTQISVDIVRHIFSGFTHKWLRDIFPDEYNIMERKYANRYTISRWPPIKSPDGKIYNVINAVKFAERIGLNGSSMCRVLNGTRKSYKGWILASEYDLITRPKSNM